MIGRFLIDNADAIREVRKYSDVDAIQDGMVHTANSDAVIHMRLFRAQRNLYISGFALFLALLALVLAVFILCCMHHIRLGALPN